MSRGLQLLTNSGASFVGATTSTPVSWNQGGRTAVTVEASAYGTIALQVQGAGGAWIPISSSFVSNQMFVFDAPAGQYRLNNSASSTILVTAALIGVPYNL